MIVKANVATKEGGRTFEWFLVRFDHTPVDQEKQKKHIPQERCGVCSIYFLTDDTSYTGGEPFASRICGEKKKFFITKAKIKCRPQDNYVKAYSRNVTMKQAITNIMAMQENDLDWDFKFDNETFKSFITTLNRQHPHGNETAQKLLQNSNYRISKKKKKQK